MNINVDLGSFWEMMSAIGTIGAVIVSLCLAWSANKKNAQPIQGVLMYSKYVYMGHSKGPEPSGLIEVGIGGENKADRIKFEGRFQFYNPSDEPKSLTNLKVVASYCFKGKKTYIDTPILENKKEYISLSPKETKVIDFETWQNKDFFTGEYANHFEHIEDYELQGTNEELKAQVFKLTNEKISG